MKPYQLGFELAKQANQPFTGGLTGGVLGNIPRLQNKMGQSPLAQRSAVPGLVPGIAPAAPLATGAAQPAIQPIPPNTGNQAAPAGGGSPMQQIPQARASSLIPKAAADYNVPGQLGSHESATFSPETFGQRTAAETHSSRGKTPKDKPKRRESKHSY